jgi:hypothetical protein
MTTSTSGRPPSVVVAIPAHNEADTLAACLRSVIGAARHALDRGRAERIVVELVCHRCTDQSVEIAGREVGRYLDGYVTEVVEPADVGAVRDLGVRQGIGRLGRPASDVWIFSTDADTIVPVDWVVRALEEAEGASVACVVGLAALDGWHGSGEARLAYDRIISDKIYLDDAGNLTHGHVYGANLVVRADAYLAAGGFISGHGEDQRLVDALVVSGYPVLRTTTLEVLTSGRTHGRASNGLADLLRRLESPISGTAVEGHDEGLVGHR